MVWIDALIGFSMFTNRACLPLGRTHRNRFIQFNENKGKTPDEVMGRVPDRAVEMWHVAHMWRAHLRAMPHI